MTCARATTGPKIRGKLLVCGYLRGTVPDGGGQGNGGQCRTGHFLCNTVSVQLGAT